MKKMKKFAALLLAVSMAAGMVACGCLLYTSENELYDSE